MNAPLHLMLLYEYALISDTSACTQATNSTQCA